MPYKPNYCCHCGEKVEREIWKLWTSRKFCENCEVAFRTEEWLLKAGLALAAVGGLLGFGSYLQKPEKPLSLSNVPITASASNKTQTAKNEKVTVNSNVPNNVVKQNVESNSRLQNQVRAGLSQKDLSPQIQPETQQNVDAEPVYFCGAQTKKGTPCTRKVKGGGRCWQHSGLPAMLPKEKLVTSQ